MTRERQPPDDESPRPGESFLARFHRRKLAAQREASLPAVSGDEPIATATTTETLEPPLTDADMPPLDSLDAESDYSGFLSPKVSDTLRRAALRKLFHSAQFNVVDGLDEYADDFTQFETLGDIVTADMRHLIEAEARKRAEALKTPLRSEPNDESETPAGAASNDDHAPADATPLPADQASSGPSDRLTETVQTDDIDIRTDA